MTNCARLLLLLSFSLAAIAEQPDTYTWSSTACPRCQSTIVYQAWFPDGSPLVAEGMSGKNTGALVALSLLKDTLVLSLGLSISHGPATTLNLKQNVTIETDSSPGMVLYALEEPPRGFRADDVAVLRSLSVRSLKLYPFAAASGFLFFPYDPRASHFVAVVKAGGETFRFPFLQDPVARAKFVDPAQGSTAAAAVAAPVARTAGCSKNVSFAVSEDGLIVPQQPDFTAKWLEKNGPRYPGLCFSQTPDPHIANYLMVFAPSDTVFSRFSPSMSSGNAAWAYHSLGTATVTTTTTRYVGLPHAGKVRTLYEFTYDHTGHTVSRRQRTVEAGRGAGPVSGLGVNLAAAMMATHLKERLLDDAVNDLPR